MTNTLTNTETSDIDLIPIELQPFVSQFDFPSGAKIWHASSREGEARSWIVETRPHRFLYEDGSVDDAPRFRAFEELGLTNGEDDLRDRPDSEWAAYAERNSYWLELSMMDLETAWRFVREHGYANRNVVVGENVSIRASGESGVVSENYGEYVKVLLDGETESRSYRLAALSLTD